MKQTMRYISVVALLMCSMMTWADDRVFIVAPTNGTVTVDNANPTGATTVTLTVTPAADYYITLDDIKVEKTSVEAQARRVGEAGPSIADPLEVTVVSVDDTGKGTYQFDLPEGNGAMVSVTFTECETFTPIVTIGNWTYGHMADEPEVTNNKSGGTVTFTYSVDGSNLYSPTVPTDAGKYTVKASIAAKGHYKAAEATADFNIYKAVLNDLFVSIGNWVFFLEPSTPSVEGNLGNGAVTYEYKVKDAGDDTYSKTVPTAVGSYTVRATVAETKNYERAMATASFEIMTVDVTKAVITLSTTSYTYDGTAKEPVVTVKVDDIVIPATYYIVAYTNNVNAGTATVTLTFKDGITGTASTTFTIEKATLKLAVSISSWVYGTTPGIPGVTGVPANAALSFVYKVKDADDKTYSSTVPTNVGSYTVRAIVAESANYKSATATADFEITPKVVENATIILSQTSYEYDGTAKEPEVTVKDGETTIPSTEYKVRYKDNIDVGEAQVSIYDCEGGNYTVNGSTTFPITEGTLSVQVSGYDDYYDTEAHGITVKATEGAEVMYGTTKIYLSQTSPTFIDVGTYTVYFEVTKPNYKPVEGSATVIIREREQGEGYALWIGKTQVTEENRKNVLNDPDPEAPRFFFDPKNNQLVITNNQEALTIESRLYNLTIFLNKKEPSKLERIFGQNGTLSITTYGNEPGSLTLDTKHHDGVICGFSEFSVTGTYMLDPKDGKYAIYDSRFILLKQSGTDYNDLPYYAIAQEASFGQTISPLVHGETITFRADDYMTTDNDGNIVKVPLDNTAINDVLHTFNQDIYPEEEDYFDEDLLCLRIYGRREPQARATRAADDGNDDQLIPGTDEYADAHRGCLTFMVPDGTGSAFVQTETEPGCQLRMRVMGDGSESVSSKDFADGMMRLDYDVAKPSYVLVWLEEDGAVRPEEKRETAHGRIYSIRVMPTSTSKNPLADIEGFPEDMISEVVVFEPTGIHEPKDDGRTVEKRNDAFYDLQGRRVAVPQKGVYIYNGKKVVIK